MTLTNWQVETALEERFENSYYFWSELDWEIEKGRFTTLTVDGQDYPVELLDSKTGREGDWQTDTFVVILVGAQAFRKTGHYASHVGTDWDGDFEEVLAKPKVIMTWERKN